MTLLSMKTICLTDSPVNAEFCVLAYKGNIEGFEKHTRNVRNVGMNGYLLQDDN